MTNGSSVATEPSLTKLASLFGPKLVLDRLTKVEIDNYRAFRGHFDLDLPGGCNLLIYGENGAGKTSLSNALADFLESPDRLFFDREKAVYRPLTHDDFRYRFNTDPTSIRLTFSSLPAGSDEKAYTWSATENDPRDPDIRTTNRSKGFLDYRSLLRVHLLRKGQTDINLFDLFLDPLLGHFKNQASAPSRTFAEEWAEIKGAFRPRLHRPPGLQDRIDNFNAGFERVAKDMVSLASDLLRDFDRELALDIDFTPATYKWRPKELVPPKITAKPTFQRMQHVDYYRILNEARLSALAVTLYFAALIKEPATGLRLLLLDDVVIGLDMANRMAILGMAEKLFRDWQVIILTYHKAWFEILKARTRDGKWSHSWRNVVLRMQKSMGAECPVIVSESGSLLRQAHHYLEIGDAKAAAVYARSAWEGLMGEFCAKWHLPVKYAERRRNLDTNAFLDSLTVRLETLRDTEDLEWARGVLQEIRHARRFVLNQHSHYNPELDDEIRAEIAAGVQAVEDFDLLLRCAEKDDFATKTEEAVSCSVGALLCVALEHLENNRGAAALDSLSRAFEMHLDELFRVREVKIPYGVTMSRRFLFAWAGRQDLFDGPTWKALRHAESYLLGMVQPGKVDSRSFKEAVQLCTRLRVIFLILKHV